MQKKKKRKIKILFQKTCHVYLKSEGLHLFTLLGGNIYYSLYNPSYFEQDSYFSR